MKLNILCCNPDGGAFYYITKGWENALTTLGHNFTRWNGSDEQLKQVKPHLYLGCSGWRQNYPNWAKDEYGTKIAIHVNPWGDNPIKRFPGEPDINETKDSIKWVEQQKPNLLYCYGLDEDIDQMWNKWKTIAKITPMPNAGDAIAHFPVPPEKQFICDIGFIGGRWPYKAMNIDKYLLPIIEKSNAQVYGWGGWKTPKYKGQIKEPEVNKLFSSAKICPSIVEPHTSRTGIDIPERMFKVPLGGGFTICDPCKGLNRFVSEKIFPMASNPKEYAELINYYLLNEDKRYDLQKQQRKTILNNHTYFNRVQNLLKSIGFEQEAEEVNTKIKSYHEMV